MRVEGRNGVSVVGECRTMHFKVDGEFICDLARTWLWDEDKPYEKCEELVLGCMEGTELGLDELKFMAQQILEGRKILKGINEFEYVDDNKKVRSIIQLLQKKQDKVDYLILEKDIEGNPLKYVDRYATHMSTNKDMNLHDYTTFELVRYLVHGLLAVYPGTNREATYRGFDISMESPEGFNYDIYSTDSYLRAGTYLFDNPRLAFDVLKGYKNPNAEELLKALTLHWNKHLELWASEGREYKDLSESEKRVYDRNWRACADLRIPFPYSSSKFEIFSKEINKELFMKDIVSDVVSRSMGRRVQDEEEAKRFIEENFEPYEPYKMDGVREWDTKDHRDSASGGRDLFTFVGTADRKGAYLKEFSWIDLNGVWYSCDFGGHTAKAMMIVRTHEKLMRGYIQYLEKNGIKRDRMFLAMDEGHFTPMEYLISLGWCKMQNTSGGYPFPIHERELTEAQKNAIFDVVVKFKFPKDPITGQRYDWDKLKERD